MGNVGGRGQGSMKIFMVSGVLMVNEYGWGRAGIWMEALGGPWRPGKVLLSTVVVSEGGDENGADGEEDLS